MLDLIIKAVQDVAGLSDKPSGSTINADTPLMGSGRVVDSIGLVTLIVDVENRVAEQTGQSVSLMDDRAMSQTRTGTEARKHGPLRLIRWRWTRLHQLQAMLASLRGPGTTK